MKIQMDQESAMHKTALENRLQEIQQALQLQDASSYADAEQIACRVADVCRSEYQVQNEKAEQWQLESMAKFESRILHEAAGRVSENEAVASQMVFRAEQQVEAETVALCTAKVALENDHAQRLISETLFNTTQR